MLKLNGERAATIEKLTADNEADAIVVRAAAVMVRNFNGNYRYAGTYNYGVTKWTGLGNAGTVTKHVRFDADGKATVCHY
jgi:hypothetical protein